MYFVKLDVKVRKILHLLHGGYEAEHADGKTIRTTANNGRCQDRGGCIYATWIALGLRVGKNGTCFPSLATLAKDTGYSKRQVQRAVDELVRIGLIEREPRQNAAGDPSSNLYHLCGWWTFGHDDEIGVQK